MKVSELVKTCNELSNEDLKVAQVKKHIKRTYAPIVEKMAVLKKLLEKCELKDKNGIVFLDMVTNKINLVYAIIVLYTDLEADKNEQGKHDAVRIYDILQESGVVDLICNQIGEREIGELTFVNKEILDTWYNEHSSTRAYLATLTDKAVRTFVEISEILGRTAVDVDPNSVMKFFGITEQTEEPKEE